MVVAPNKEITMHKLSPAYVATAVVVAFGAAAVGAQTIASGGVVRGTPATATTGTTTATTGTTTATTGGASTTPATGGGCTGTNGSTCTTSSGTTTSGASTTATSANSAPLNTINPATVSSSTPGATSTTGAAETGTAANASAAQGTNNAASLGTTNANGTIGNTTGTYTGPAVSPNNSGNMVGIIPGNAGINGIVPVDANGNPIGNPSGPNVVVQVPTNGATMGGTTIVATPLLDQVTRNASARDTARRAKKQEPRIIGLAPRTDANKTDQIPDDKIIRY
jgi:hypothetical protein